MSIPTRSQFHHARRAWECRLLVLVRWIVIFGIFCSIITQIHLATLHFQRGSDIWLQHQQEYDTNVQAMTEKKESTSKSPTATRVIVPDASVVLVPDNTTATEQQQQESETEPTWLASTVIPEWVKEYAGWHQEQRKLLTEENWEKHQFFVMRCLSTDLKCGGTADRLTAIPAKLKFAAHYERILLILWERPARLEEFLVPPPGGIDWTVPEWLHTKLLPLLTQENSWMDVRDGRFAEVFEEEPKRTVVHTAYPFPDAALFFEDIYSELWSMLFQPSPKVQYLIDHEMKKLNLIPGEYNALHIRSRYRKDESLKGDLINIATECALYSRGFAPPGPISNATNLPPLYVATDATPATKAAVELASKYNSHVAARTDERAPTHLDRGANFLGRKYSDLPPEMYYSTFVDLYLLSSARCIAFGRGGFGQWANLISADSTCAKHYWNQSHRFYLHPSECNVPDAFSMLHPAS